MKRSLEKRIETLEMKLAILNPPVLIIFGRRDSDNPKKQIAVGPGGEEVSGNPKSVRKQLKKLYDVKKVIFIGSRNVRK